MGHTVYVTSALFRAAFSISKLSNPLLDLLLEWKFSDKNTVIWFSIKIFYHIHLLFPCRSFKLGNCLRHKFGHV